MDKAQTIKTWIKQKAHEAGFDDCGITDASLPDAFASYLQDFIKQDRHGEMTWLAEHADRRANPKAMWQDAQSAIICTLNYGPDHNPMDNLEWADKGNISVYARGRDYHDVLKGKLKQLAGQIASRLGADVKVFVDTAPLAEKPLAAQAGIGWQGKHTNLVSRTHGSWLFLGTILLSASLPSDDAEGDHCGSCRACLDVCPTNAFPAPYQLDARKCISYMTIEQKSQIAPEYRVAIGNRIFGCDDCLAVCPWNKFAQIAAEQKLHPKHQPALLPLADYLAFDEALFRSHFATTPVRRAGFERFMRNVLIAAGNAQSADLVPFIKRHLTSEMVLVQSMAIWALSRYYDAEQMADLRPKNWQERDDIITQEWQRALG